MNIRLIEQTACQHGRFGADCADAVCDGSDSRILSVDYGAALEVLRHHRPEWTEYVGDPFVIENVVDAALGVGSVKGPVSDV